MQPWMFGKVAVKGLYYFIKSMQMQTQANHLLCTDEAVLTVFCS